MVILLQGLPKQHSRLKKRVLNSLFDNYMQSNPLGLTTPPNAHYRSTEMQSLLTDMSLTGKSAEQMKKEAFRDYGFHHPDQQTLRVRLEKHSSFHLEGCINLFLQQSDILTSIFRPAFLNRLRKTKKSLAKSSKPTKPTRSKRRQLRKHPRKLQRDRGVKRPDGIYLSTDGQNIPYYGELDVELANGENLQSYVVKDRPKESTTKFYQFHTLYSFEKGFRHILGVHLLRRKLVEDKWTREPIAPVVAYLIEPWLQKIVVRGLVADGLYYNEDVIDYLLLKQLDFVIRADMSPTMKTWCKEENLMHKLDDGEAVVVPGGRLLKNKIQLKQVVVKRDTELLCLVYPTYSKLKAQQVVLLFEERFGIETSFRELGVRRGFTTSISPHYRFSLFSTAVAVYNLLLSYQELVVTGSSDPGTWKVTMMELMHLLHDFLGKYMSDGVERAESSSSEG